MSAEPHPEHPIAELRIRNVNERTYEERETIAHLLQYYAAKLTTDDDFHADPHGHFSVGILDVDTFGDGD